ncbi:MAG: cytochrome c [Acidobacteria bacterium]|nr:cytochrome c [Acidobacteriota bacterium]
MAPRGAAFALLGALALTGCRQDMHDQPRYRPFAATDFFGDRRASRPAIPGTVARGMLKTDTGYWTGKAAGKEVERYPLPLTREVLERGRDRFNIYCQPCHGAAGYGNGIIVTRGLKNPPSYHTDALREAPIGHFVDVMTNGSGSMLSYASRVPVRDRWAIAAYIRVLQQSQNVKAGDLSAEERQKVNAPEARAAEPKKEAAH